MLNAKTKLGVAAIVAALAGGAVVRSRLDDPAPAAGPPAVTPAEATAARMAGTTGDEPATSAVRARAPAVPKLQAASSSSAPPIAYGKPHPIAWADLPPHFRSVLSQIALGRTIQMRDRRLDRWKGQIRTRLTFEVEGVRHEVMLDEQGTLVASEVDFHPGELPPVVLAGIKADSPDAVIVKADRQWRYDEPVYFDVDLLQDGRRLQLHVSEDGRITEKKWK